MGIVWSFVVSEKFEVCFPPRSFELSCRREKKNRYGQLKVSCYTTDLNYERKDLMKDIHVKEADYSSAVGTNSFKD